MHSPRSTDTPPLPSTDINPGNALSKIQDCQKFMTLQLWTHFQKLYEALHQFQEIRVKGAGKMLRDDDEFTCAWNSLRANSVDTILKNIESSVDFDEFMLWMHRLADIVEDRRTLWVIIHTEVQPFLKVTLEQSHTIASTFFSPTMVFEFGVDTFLQSPLCEISPSSTEDNLIDAFYAATGFIKACCLPNDYQIKAPQFIDFIRKLLQMFVDLPEFDANKFIGIVESMHQNFHMSEDSLRGAVLAVIQNFSSRPIVGSAIGILSQWCILSTSPFLQGIPLIKEMINTTFKEVISEQRAFVRTYVFGCFVECIWDDEHPAGKGISEPLRAWQLYMENCHRKIAERPELPKLLMLDLVDDSLSYFTGYYGEVQPSLARAPSLRMDIFAIVDTCKNYYPGEMQTDTLQKVYYLLYIAAVCGASDEQIEKIRQIKWAGSDLVWLGLQRSQTDFSDYAMALGRLSEKFESEAEAFPEMVSFIRKNY